MHLSADWKEFIELLNSHGVDYVIVGAHCLAFHGRPRFTGDLDILVRPTRENAAKLARLLATFGFAAAGMKEEDFVEADQVIQLGRPPYRIDLLTGLSGVETDAALTTKVHAILDGLPVSILSKRLLIENKRTVGRSQDLADIEALQEC